MTKWDDEGDLVSNRASAKATQGSVLSDNRKRYLARCETSEPGKTSGEQLCLIGRAV